MDVIRQTLLRSTQRRQSFHGNPNVDLKSKQDLSVDVSGPEGANKLLIFTGTVGIGYLGSGVGEHKETLSFNVGPSLTHQQFHRAIATASLAKMTINNPGQVMALRTGQLTLWMRIGMTKRTG